MSISVSADTLREQSRKIKYINRQYDIAICAIDTAIKKAAAIDESEIIYSPLMLYDKTELSHEDCQALIFDKIIKELEKNKYIVILDGNPQDDDLVFIISWHLDCSSSQIIKCRNSVFSHHKEIIDAHRKKKTIEQKDQLIKLQKLYELEFVNVASNKKIQSRQNVNSFSQPFQKIGNF